MESKVTSERQRLATPACMPATLYSRATSSHCGGDGLISHFNFFLTSLILLQMHLSKQILNATLKHKANIQKYWISMAYCTWLENVLHCMMSWLAVRLRTADGPGSGSARRQGSPALSPWRRSRRANGHIFRVGQQQDGVGSVKSVDLGRSNISNIWAAVISVLINISNIE